MGSRALFGAKLLLFLSATILAQAQPKFKVVESFANTWNGREAKIILEIPERWENPGEFTRIRIEVPGEKDFVAEDQDGFVSPFDENSWIPKKLLDESAQSTRSKNLLILPLSKTPKHRVIVLIGYAYASSPGAIWVLDLGPKGAPFVLFRKQEMGLSNLADLDGDGVRELIGYPCLHEMVGDIETYDPFQIFKFTTRTGWLSLPLTEKYNREKYVWAGPNCSEKVGVRRGPGDKLHLVRIPSQ